MKQLWTHLSAFLSGALMVTLGVMIYLLKSVKPVINTSTYVEKMETQLKKLKVEGDGNDTSLTTGLNQKKKRRKFLGIIKRKTKKP